MRSFWCSVSVQMWFDGLTAYEGCDIAPYAMLSLLYV
jgi:hypothetical protein